MDRYPCRYCTERHFACWDRCEKYQEATRLNRLDKVVDEAEAYINCKGKKYKTKYGWRE